MSNFLGVTSWEITLGVTLGVVHSGGLAYGEEKVQPTNCALAHKLGAGGESHGGMQNLPLVTAWEFESPQPHSFIP